MFGRQKHLQAPSGHGISVKEWNRSALITLSNLVQALMAFLVKEHTQEIMWLIPQRYYITKIINVRDNLLSSQSLWPKPKPRQDNQ